MSVLKTNLWEIERSPLLNHLGALLSVFHVINYFFWVAQKQLGEPSGNTPLLCWEFFPSCSQVLLKSPGFFTSLLTVYLVFSCLGFLAFLWRRFVVMSWAFLFLTSVLHLTFYILDASLASDMHGFLIFIEFTFLFVPNKLSSLRFGLISFYLLLTLRELNGDWLSGASLNNIFPFPLKGLEWVAAFGVVIKLTLPFLLVSSVGQRVALGVSGLLTFHSFHFYFKKDFESIVMGILVLFFILDHFERVRLEREAFYQSFAHPEPSKLWWPIFICLYLLAQTPLFLQHWPTELIRVVGPSNAAECQQTTFVRYQNKTEQLDHLLPPHMKSQIRCHPLLAFNAARDLCSQLKDESGFMGISTYFLSRSLSDQKFRPVLSISNVCAEGLTFKTAAGAKQ